VLLHFATNNGLKVTECCPFWVLKKENVMTRTLRKGSSKDIYTELDDSSNPFQVYFDFSDRVSVLDVGEILVPFVGLGKLRCAIAGRIFQALNSAGFSNHYISHDTNLARMYVQPVNIPALNIDYGDIASYKLMPVELLCRLALTKKFIVRIESGEVSRQNVERLLVGQEMREGARLDPGFVECSTKFEEADRYITDTAASTLIGISNLELRSYYNIVQNVFSFLYTFFRSSGGFLLMDGKLEAALAPDGYMMLVDSISPDELRLIGPDGRSYDKDPVREWYQNTFPDWYAELLTAKQMFPNNKKQWPTYPDVPPQSVIDDMVDRYATVAREIGAI
jgi:phosphoribosylaminoimidazole-succinocarboxamide synthase